MSTLAVNALQAQTGTNLQVATGHSITAPGIIKQIQSVDFSGTQSGTGDTYVDITNLSITMTPTATSSKFFISTVIAGSNSSHFSYFRIVRGSTQLKYPDGYASFSRSTSHFGFQSHADNGAGYQMFFLPAQHLDSPNTASAVTYKIQAAGRASAGTWYVNRTPRDNNNSDGYDGRGVSTLTVMEVLQ